MRQKTFWKIQSPNLPEVQVDQVDQSYRPNLSLPDLPFHLSNPLDPTHPGDEERDR